MGVFLKSQKISPDELDALQQKATSPEIAARVQALTDNARAKSIASGRSIGWTDLPGQIKKIYQENGIEIPDGYDVDMEGQIVYTNKTPYLQQAAWASLPIAGPSAVKALAGGGGPAPLTALEGGGGTVPTTTAPGGGGFLSKMLGGVKKFFGGRGGDVIGRVLEAGGRGVADATQAAATNRGVSLDAELEAQRLRQQQQKDYHDLLIKRSEDDRASGLDAFTKSTQANRVLNDTGYKPAMISQMPGQAPTALPSFGTALPAPNAQQKSDAQALYDEVKKRLYGGSQLPALAEPVPFQNDPKYMNPGPGERIGGWVAPILSAAGAARKRPYPIYNPNDPRTDPYRGQD